MSNVLITQEQIQTRLKEIAQEINSKYDEITLLVTLTGGVYTAVDLSKYITIPCKLEFVKISCIPLKSLTMNMIVMIMRVVLNNAVSAIEL